jgi:hypothetical protein
MRWVRGESRGACRFGNLRYGRLGSCATIKIDKESLCQVKPVLSWSLQDRRKRSNLKVRRKVWAVGLPGIAIWGLAWRCQGRGMALPITHCTSRSLPGTQFNRRKFAPHKRMNSRICICCGEPMPEEGNARSRNPNLCASCSSLFDGMEDSSADETASLAPGQEPTREWRADEAADPSVHHDSIWL